MKNLNEKLFIASQDLVNWLNGLGLTNKSRRLRVPADKLDKLEKVISDIETYHGQLKEQAERTAQEFILNHSDNKYLGFSTNQPDKLSMIVNILDEYHKQGRYFTKDEIRKIQETAYDAGFDADKT